MKCFLKSEGGRIKGPGEMDGGLEGMEREERQDGKRKQAERQKSGEKEMKGIWPSLKHLKSFP